MVIMVDIHLQYQCNDTEMLWLDNSSNGRYTLLLIPAERHIIDPMMF